MRNELTQALWEIFPQGEKGDFYNIYMYLKHLDHFIYKALEVSGMPAKRPESEISEDVEEMLEAVVLDIAENAGSRDTSTYHGKVIKLREALQFVSQKENISLEAPETVIPYKQARSIILENPTSLAVGECPCRAVAENPCLPEGERDVCLFVGDPQSAFLAEYNQKFRSITQDEAVRILEDVHEKGFVHCAYFKKHFARRFVAICNCCSCCCQGMKAWNMFGGAIPILASSGYVAEISDECMGCGDCVSTCNFFAISMDENEQKAVVDLEKCMGCGVCEDKCSTGAISLRREPSKGEPLDLAELLNKV
ncbi:MAG: 4Fe-4S dicluster domain-containing protein [Chloroflexi bacterium]|nr:4Fe-4S dicluster domain-containing protein [Chloroflexota bacterium]